MKHPARISKKATRKSGAPPGPRRSDQRRAALIQAAGELFIEKGYESATMDEIAAAAGFAKGTLYHYFTNKADLLHALRENFDREITQRIRTKVETCPADDLQVRIETWVDAAVEAYFDMCKLHDVVIYSTGMPFRNAMVDSGITRYLAELITEGVQAGAWRVEDPRWTAMVMFYSFRGGCDEAMIGAQPAEDVPRKLKDVFLRMLDVQTGCA